MELFNCLQRQKKPGRFTLHNPLCCFSLFNGINGKYEISFSRDCIVSASERNKSSTIVTENNFRGHQSSFCFIINRVITILTNKWIINVFFARWLGVIIRGNLALNNAKIPSTLPFFKKFYRAEALIWSCTHTDCSVASWTLGFQWLILKTFVF